MKKDYPRVCLEDSAYSLFLYFLISSKEEIESTYYFFSDGIPQTVCRFFQSQSHFFNPRYCKNRKIYHPVRFFYSLFLRWTAAWRWPFLKTANLYGLEICFFSPMLVGYRKMVSIEDGFSNYFVVDRKPKLPYLKRLFFGPLINCEGNIVLTPHLGASTQEAQMNVAIDVAQQIKEVLSGGSASSAVNIPSLRPDKLEPVKDYMQIAENSGEFVEQISEGVIKSIEITAYGYLADLDIQPLEVAVLKGILSSILEGVNYVNAPFIAKKRGIDIISTRSKVKCSFAGLLTVKLTTDKTVNIVSGALVAKNMPRIVKINDYEATIRPQKHMLIIPHVNKPSMIAKVAKVIGENNINIGSMNVVQKNDNHATESIMVINIDSEVNDNVLNEIEKIEGVHNPKYLNLSA